MNVHKLNAILVTNKQLKPPPGVKPSPVSLRDWEEAVGSRIARRAQPARVERGVLHVRVANAAWANELSMLADDILAQLHARGLEVEALRFSVGHIDARQAEAPLGREVKRAPPPDAPVPREVTERIDGIGDPELRSAVAGAAARALAMRRK